MGEPDSVIDTLLPRVPERGIHSRTLHSSADAKVVLFAFAAFEELSEHTASRPATVQIISGRFELTLADERVERRAGRVGVHGARPLALVEGPRAVEQCWSR